MKDMTGKITIDDTVGFDADGFSGQIYVDNKENAGFNVLLITVNGRHPKKRMIDTTRNYYVTEGQGTFILDGHSHEAIKGDLFIVGPGHEYEYSGTMLLFEFNISPDNSFKDQILE